MPGIPGRDLHRARGRARPGRGSTPRPAPPPLRFESLRPAFPAAAGYWKRAATYARSLLDDDQAATIPLILSSVNRMLAATVLAVFPNNLLTDPTRQDRLDAHPGTLRRAAAFIDEHAHQDIAITADPADQTVTAIAHRWGFDRTSRFAALYQQAYGVPPSHTLHQDEPSL